jgi:hypothetical protein
MGIGSNMEIRMFYLIVAIFLVWSSDKIIRVEMRQVENKAYIRDWFLTLIDVFLVSAGVAFAVAYGIQ